MSIATEISRLQSAKADIKTAIEGKGVSVPSSALLDDYADYIELIQGGDGLTNEVKDALLDLARNIAYTTPDAQELYDALFEAFYPVSSISAVFDQGENVIYDTDSLDDLKQYLTVTATYDDGTSGTVTGYTLSGTLTEGTSAITVSYSGKSTTFNVVVSTEWDANPTLLYNASDGVTLSNDTNMFTGSTLGTNVTETMGDGYCRITSPNASTTTNSSFPLSDATSTKCKLMTKVRFVSLPVNDGTGAGLRMQVSNGTNGASMLERYDRTARKNYFVIYNGSTAQNIDLTLNKWYTIELERTATQQIITIDGVEVFRGAYSTYYCTANKVLAVATKSTVTGAPDTIVDVAWMAYYDKD